MRVNRIWLLTLVLLAFAPAAFAQSGGKRSSAAHRHPTPVMVAPGAPNWVAPPAGMTQGTPSVESEGTMRFAPVQGDSAKAGVPFTVEVGCTDGYKIAPHWHPTSENVVVIQGAIAVGMGDTFDAAAAKELPTGAYGYIPARMHHFALCKGETRMLIYGIGPFQINFVGPASPAEKKPAGK